MKRNTMALHHMATERLRSDYHGPNCAYLCWLPIVMGFLSLSVGICCLFFMCRLGVTLCILNCVLGLVFSYITYSTHARPKRYKAVVAIIGNLLHISLLVFTFVHGSRLLVLNVRAEAKNNAADVSPTFNLMLDYYFAHAGFEHSPSLHRLEDAKEPSSSPSPTASTGLGDSPAASGTPPLPPPDRGVSAPDEAAASPLLPIFSTVELAPGQESEPQGLLTTQTKRFESILYNLSLSAQEASRASVQPDDTSEESSESRRRTRRRRRTQKKKGRLPQARSDTTSVTPVESSQEDPYTSCNFSTEDFNCVLKAATSPIFAVNVLRRFRLLLYWGLFCGYVERGLIIISRRNIGCSEICHFDAFHFSKYRRNGPRTRTQAAQLMKSIQSMTREQARFCAVNATVASCRVEEKFIQHGVAAALCAALPLSFVLAIFCFTCIIACWKIAHRCGKKVQST